MVGAAGVALTGGLVALIVSARNVLVLIGLALFLAVGLEPAVASLVRRGVPRWAAIAAVCGGLLAVVGGVVAAAVPPLIAQVGAFRAHAPTYLKVLTDHNSLVGRLNDRFHLQQSLEQALTSRSGGIVGGVFGAGVVVVNAVASTGVVVVLTVYLLGSLPELRTGFHRLIPRSRRSRVIRLGDEIAARVSGYVLGNLATSLVAAILTYIWLLIFKVPYPLLLSVLVGLLDLIPTVGSTIAGVVVCLAAWTVSLPVALGTVGYFVVYRLFEDYLLSPRIFSRAVQVSPLATIVAVLLGGTLLGIIGALVAIPIAAAVQLIVREVALPRLDEC
nr:AI-2E family transporter [Pseudonocardia acidicola]